ncbi:MAG: hypothetical protein ACM3JJ_10520, partial [Hyphomicrobiales bacterium]
LHVAIVLGAGLVGMSALHDGLAFACETRDVYPKKAMTIMKVWAVLFAFVGIQMAWNLQPFVGDRDRPFQLFRHNEGNFYTAVIYSIDKLARGQGQEAAPTTTRGQGGDPKWYQPPDKAGPGERGAAPGGGGPAAP